MPRPLPVLDISIDQFHTMPHRLGWKHEYWDGKARLSPNLCSLAAFQRSTAWCSRETAPQLETALQRGCETGQFHEAGSRDEKVPEPKPLDAGLEMRRIETGHESKLIDLFIEAFDDCVLYCGYPDDAYRKEAVKSVRGASEHSFGVWEGNRLVAACLIRFRREHWMLSPIMVAPSHQRRRIGRRLLWQSLQSLQYADIGHLCSYCHLGNEASMNWHEQNKFQEIPTYFACSARCHHHDWMARHYESIGDTAAADQHRRAADRWEQMMTALEESQQAFKMDPFE